MKKNLMVHWVGVVCLLAGLARGGTVSVSPSSKTYLQTQLTNGVSVSLPITLTGWGDTNLTVSANGGGAIFTPSVSPATEAPQSTDRLLLLNPKGAAGSTTVTVSVNGSGFSPETTSVSLTVTAVPVLSGLQETATFNEDVTYTDPFSVAYWGSTSDLNWTSIVVTGSSVLQSAAVTGTGLTRDLVLTPLANKSGSASVMVIVRDSLHAATQTVAVSVGAVPDPPWVTGLPASLSLNEDTSSNHVFTVTDLDDGTSGSISSAATVTGGASSLFTTVSVSGTTLQLTPAANAYGWATVRVVTASSLLATTNSILVKVLPVADAPTVSSWPTGTIELEVGGAPSYQPLSAVTVADVDHLAYKNGTSNEFLQASVDVNVASIQFSPGGNGSSTTNLTTGSIPANVTTWVRGLSLYPPETSYVPVGKAITNTLTLHVNGFGSNDLLSVSKTLPVVLINPNHPPHFIPAVSPSSMLEGQTITPFTISQVFDQDVIHTTFSLQLFVKPADAGLASLSSAGVMYGNEAELYTQLHNVGLVAANGVMSTLTTNVTIYYVMSDSIDFVTNSATILINQVKTAPVINGIDELASYYSINDVDTVEPFPTVITYDTDQGGHQLLRAAFSVSDTRLGGFVYNEFATTELPLQSQTLLQEALRDLIFVPSEGALPIGTSGEVKLTLSVTDATGITTVNNKTRVLITAVNKPPKIKVPQAQPVLLPPGGDLRPFAGTTVTNDDLNSVKLTITLDDSSKGTLDNLGGFTGGGGAYTMSGTIEAINASLTNLTYAVNPEYVFPSDNPGGTVFALEAEDYQIKLGSAQVWVQIQDLPRNHLVTKAANDGTPGSLLFALAHASNNDVITFALPEYPSVIRVPEAYGPLVLSTALTLKGPGADLLTISGDGDGDGDSDGQIFVVQSRVTIEGLTLSQGHATFGGAVSVAQEGALTLRSCAVVDSEADEYGGGIDVEGSLLLENCYLARNRVTATGFGGGAVAFFTSHDSSIVNTTFASNRVDNSGGYGGGAVYVERDDAPINVAVTHCTFAGNADASGRASAVYVVGGNSFATLKNTIFSDFSAQAGARNIDVTGDGWVVSQGGNVCDDTTRTAHQQSGGTSVYLLTHTGDKTAVMPGLGGLTQAKGDVTPTYPLTPGSPANHWAQSSGVITDQRARIRRSEPRDSGAVQQNASERVAITEIQLSAEEGDTDQFIELFVPRDGQAVNLSGFSLFVNGVAVHQFGLGSLALTNSVYPNLVPAAGIPASYILFPGRGVVVVFPKGSVADFTGFSALNPTPVVRASIATNAAEFGRLVPAQERGSVSVAKTATDAPVLLQTFLRVFSDPDDEEGTNLLATAYNSIVCAPQSRGFAFIPHSAAGSAAFAGWQGRPSITPAGVLLQSPGATVEGTPFGLRNATPVAVGDSIVMTEDDVGVFGVLDNDLDADGNDRLFLVDVSTTSGIGSGNAAAALSQLGAAAALSPSDTPLQGTEIVYDPRDAATLQALPVGVEILDTFYYETIDYGFGAVGAIAGGTASNTWVTVVSHRLSTGESVSLSGVSVGAYNGTFAVTVLDDNTFAIPVPFVTAAAEPGVWETSGPRTPSARSESAVTVRVTGVNDAPVACRDVVTNVTEASRVRIMVRPELANAALSLPGDPMPAPVPNPAHLIDNDYDIDTDDTWQTLRLVGVMGAVHAVLDYSGTPGQTPVTLLAPGHGLADGTEILIANYGGHPSYNGFSTVTVVDADTLTIPRFFVDNDDAKGVWVVLSETNRYHAVTDVGAAVDLTLRADIREDHLIYDASTSSFLNGLAEGERFTNRFYQAVVDSHGAIGIGPVDVEVVGLNDPPIVLPDPDGLGVLAPLVNPSNTLAQVLANGLDILYTLPPASCATGRIDVQVLDRSDTILGTLVLQDLWTTDERTPIAIAAVDLLANDTDIDRIDVLSVVAAEAFSREGAALTLAGGQIVYDPTASDSLHALARDERVIDTFNAVVSDAMTGGSVTALVAVAVVGLNDTPVANPDWISLSEDDVFAFNPISHPLDTPAAHDYDIDMNGAQPDDRLTVIVVSNLITVGEARVDTEPLLARYDARVSQLLNQLADWQVYTDSFDYAISDNSFLFVTDDEFYVPTNTVERSLDVLANDRDFTPQPSALTIVDAGPTLRGGTVALAAGGKRLLYTSPAGFAGDDYFRYTVETETGLRRSARVLVRSVAPPLNGVLSAANDHFAVAFGETAVLDVLANDNMLPWTGAGLVLSTNVFASSIPGQPVVSGNAFVYTATDGLSPLTFQYEVSAGGTSVARAEVVVDIVDRRGTLPVQDDRYSVPAGSCTNVLDVLSNDSLVTGSTEHLRIAGLIDSAAFGTAALNPTSTALIYTPDPGFVGVEQLRYLASDGIGGTGTGVVTVVVGKIDTVVDFFTVAATTNTTPVNLDVLGNDRVQPFEAGALTLVSVNPPSSAIGTLSVNGSGTRLQFVPSNVVGQVDFVYLVADGSARTATGSVTIATVAAGIYANTDRYFVRGSGGDYTLDVLANDRSYPDVDKIYTILSIGTGSEAPNAGGSVSIVDNRLRYTPVPGYIGQERFTYTMSDSLATDSAWVTVTVRPGDLHANKDHYDVFYELEDGTNARAFTLPVVRNDRIQPPLGQAIQITGLGVGTNAPDHGGSVVVGLDGVSLVYRPVAVPLGSYVERFTYEISDGAERRASAEVEVQVINRDGALAGLTQNDAFTVARNSLDNELPLLRNDFVLPGTAGDWSITAVSASLRGGAVSISGNQARYSPPADFVGLDTFTYNVSDGLGGTGSATVRVRVGALSTMPDLFEIVSGAVSNAFDVVANDVLSDDYSGEHALAGAFGASQGGSVWLSPTNTLIYSPDPAYAGPYPYAETFLYTVQDESAVLVTGTVRVVVHEAGSDRSATTVTVRVEGRNDQPVILNTATNWAITDKQTVKPFALVTFIEVDQQTLEPIDVVVSLDSALKGALVNLGAFIDLGEGRYGLSGKTAAAAVAQLRELIYVPVENRITVPTTERVRFTVVITDNKSEPVVDTQTAIDVTAANDAPVIEGTRAGQTVYAATTIRLFSSVTIRDVDDHALQPLDVTVTMSDATHGALVHLGRFVSLGGGVYRATGLTPEEATRALRELEFLYGAGKVVFGNPMLTVFQITVDDHFAAPVSDSHTSVRAYDAYEGMLQPTNQTLQVSFGTAVDIGPEFAVVGAPSANANGTDSGSALIYRLVPGTTNTWSLWRQLQPGAVDASDKFGASVSISSDWIAVGATRDEAGSTASGAVYMFNRNQGGSNNWGLVTRIAPSGLPATSLFGTSVDLDGDRLAVGAPKATLTGAAVPQGVAFVYERNAGGANAWGEVARKVPSDAISLDFGWSVSVSGPRLIVGAPQNISPLAESEPKGAVYCFARDAGGTNSWGQVQRLTEVQFTYKADFGFSVSVDGDTLAIGAPSMTNSSQVIHGQTSLYRFAEASNGWYRIAHLMSSNSLLGMRFGYSVSVNKDFVLVGAPAEFNPVATGEIYLYRRDPLTNTVWRLVEAFSRPREETGGSTFGEAVSFKGELAIVGALDDMLIAPFSTGNAYIYRFKFNNSPVVAQAVPDQLAEWNQPFEYTVPDGVFADPDVGDTLDVRVALADDGQGLGVAGMTVTGTPTTIGAVPVNVLATDAGGASAADAFSVIVQVNGVYVEPTPRNKWNLFYFGAAVADPALQATVWGGEANGDGDTLNNDHEYAFGGDPTVGDGAGVIMITPGGADELVISYNRRTNDPALTYVLQGTLSLSPADWQDIRTLVVGESVVPAGEGMETVHQTVRVEAAGPVMFFRVTVLP